MTLSWPRVPKIKRGIGFSIPDGAGFTVKSSPGFLRISVTIPVARWPQVAMPPLSYDSKKDDNLKIDPNPKDRRYLEALLLSFSTDFSISVQAHPKHIISCTVTRNSEQTYRQTLIVHFEKPRNQEGDRATICFNHRKYRSRRGRQLLSIGKGQESSFPPFRFS